MIYRPKAGWAADFIPFYWNGQFHLFYLQDWRDAATHGEGTPWWHIVTRDFVHFEEWGEALTRGERLEQDLWVFTGCVVVHEGVFHIFYTGHNPHFPSLGKPQQAVMHATSLDLRKWTKHPQDTFHAPIDGDYERDDWRDPFVYRDERTGQWSMLLASRKRVGLSRKRGVTARCVSTDLQRWEVTAPFWEPDAYYTHECPDLFRMGDWWYLIFSEFSETSQTRYRMSRSPDGPWCIPPALHDDCFDTPMYYAAKTASNGVDRYLFGWLATRDGNVDTGGKQWGGSLVVHKVIQRADGSLGLSLPDSIAKQFPRSAVSGVRTLSGQWMIDGNVVGCRSASTHSLARVGSSTAEATLVEVMVTIHSCAEAVGIALRMDGDADSLYELRLEPRSGRIVLDKREGQGPAKVLGTVRADLPLGRPIPIRVLLDGECLVAYVDDAYALSSRLQGLGGDGIGVFVKDGEATFGNPSVATRSVPPASASSLSATIFKHTGKWRETSSEIASTSLIARE